MSAMGDSDRGDKRLTIFHKKLRGVPLWVAGPAEHFHTRNENKSFLLIFTPCMKMFVTRVFHPRAWRRAVRVE